MEFNDLIIYIMYSMIQKPELAGIIACVGTIIACIVNILSNKMTKQQFDWVREDREFYNYLYKVSLIEKITLKLQYFLYVVVLVSFEVVITFV